MSTTEKSTETVALEIELRHAPEKVWRAITQPELLAQWLLPLVESELHFTPGTKFTYTAPPQPGWDGYVHCEVVEIDEPRRLVYSWRTGEGWLDTMVTFTLAPTTAGTRLSVVQTGFKPDQKQASGGARYGWKMMTGRLVELLEKTS